MPTEILDTGWCDTRAVVGVVVVVLVIGNMAVKACAITLGLKCMA